MSFKTDLLADASALFLNTNEFAEAITYLPYGEATRAIKAVIERDTDAELREMSGVIRPVLRVHVANSATVGILATELDTALDRITAPRLVGGSAETLKIDRIISQDEGMLILETH